MSPSPLSSGELLTGELFSERSGCSGGRPRFFLPKFEHLHLGEKFSLNTLFITEQ